MGSAWALEVFESWGSKQWPGPYGERVEREPITGVWGRSNCIVIVYKKYVVTIPDLEFTTGCPSQSEIIGRGSRRMPAVAYSTSLLHRINSRLLLLGLTISLGSIGIVLYIIYSS